MGGGNVGGGTDESRDRRPRFLGLFAHPDDEVFCVGGTFARAAEQGADTMVVSFTKGEAGGIRHAEIATRKTLGNVRNAELDRACTELGVKTVRCLDFSDGQLPESSRETLVEAAVKIIRDFKPDFVFSFDQTGAYGHPDHIVMSEVSRAACERAGDPAEFPDAGPPFEPEELFHAQFPQNDRLLLRALVDWLTGLDDRFRGTDEFANALLMFADGTTMLGYASDHLTVQWFPTGSFIIEQGEPAVSLYLVLSGAVDVIVESADGSTMQVGSVKRGEFLGEAGIAQGELRNAHCVAAENTACFVLSPERRSQHAPRGAAGSSTSNNGTGTSSSNNGTGTSISGNGSSDADPGLASDLVVDVAAWVQQKVCALSQHRSQYAVTPDLFPDAMMQELLGTEYFSSVWSARAGSGISEEWKKAAMQ